MGRTSRPFPFILKNTITASKRKIALPGSALTEHTKTCSDCSCINDFDLEFLKVVSNPVDASLAEARLIDCLNPELNRRHERAGAVRVLV